MSTPTNDTYTQPANNGLCASPDKTLDKLRDIHDRIGDLYRELWELTDAISGKRRVHTALLEALQWYVDNDDTSASADNQFWLDGLARAQAALNKAKGEAR